MNKTLLIVGLGNIGKNYQQTRHNLGFICIDAFAAEHDFDNWVEKKDLKCLLTLKNIGNNRVVLAKPTTMMNLSGEAVQAAARFYKVSAEETLAVYDEHDMPFGQVRTRVGGSAAGHNGVKSLISYIGAEFSRVRVGIKPPEESRLDMSDYVLAKMSRNELGKLGMLTRETNDIISSFVFSGKVGSETRSFDY